MTNNRSKNAMDTALSYLSRRQLTVSKLKGILEEKGFPEESIETTINKLVEWKYLNDEEYALTYIQSRRDKYSKKRTSVELQRAGIEKEQISRLLEKQYTEAQEYENCLHFAQRYWEIESNKWEIKYKNQIKYQKIPRLLFLQKKVGDKLLMQGFPWGIVKDVLAKEFSGNT
jgi:regulatory protein